MEELGWDASIQRLALGKPEDDKTDADGRSGIWTAAADSAQAAAPEALHPQYILSVRVDEQVFRRFVTVSPISLSGADGIIGRGTRVWAARELLDNGEQSDDIVAIKDYWIDADQEREGDVVQSIMDAAPDEAGRAKLKNHIVDILCHGDVHRNHTGIVKRDGEHPEVVHVIAPDSTCDLREAIARREAAVESQRQRAHAARIASQSDQLASGVYSPYSYFAPIKERRPLAGVRIHNRLVMKQVGRSLHSEKSLRTAFSALHDVCTGQCVAPTSPAGTSLTASDYRAPTNTLLWLDAS